MTKIIFFILMCADCNLSEITMSKNPNVDCFDYGKKVMKHLEYKEGSDNVRAGYYTKSGYLVIGYRCE